LAGTLVILKKVSHGLPQTLEVNVGRVSVLHSMYIFGRKFQVFEKEKTEIHNMTFWLQPNHQNCKQ
jgi:hypothetical protein